MEYPVIYVDDTQESPPFVNDFTPVAEPRRRQWHAHTYYGVPQTNVPKPRIPPLVLPRKHNFTIPLENFTSLSQRERVRQKLLQQIQNDLWFDERKREAYAETLWTEDVEKNRISLADKTLKTITDLLPKKEEAKTEIKSEQPPPRPLSPSDVGDQLDSLSDLDDAGESDNEYESMDTSDHPIGLDGRVNKHVHVGRDAALIHNVNGQKSTIPITTIDWVATHRYVVEKLATFETIRDMNHYRNKHKTRLAFDELALHAFQSKQARKEREIMHREDVASTAMRADDNAARVKSEADRALDMEDARLEAEAKIHIVQLFATQPDMMKIIDPCPVGREKNDANSIHVYETFQLGFLAGDIYISSRKTNKKAPAVQRLISWRLTLKYTFSAARQKGINLSETSSAFAQATTAIPRIRPRLRMESDDEEMGSGFFHSRLIHTGKLKGGACLNLRKIEGSGSASDQNYKRLGSKFIRMKDLHENKLKLVYPNRTQVGHIRAISPNLSKVINELVFNKNINQQLYDALSVDDKKLFHEILRATHLQHSFSEPLRDPMEQLQAEFDKLRSQILIGNNNPDLIRELRASAVDLYSHKLISEDEFKQIML